MPFVERNEEKRIVGLYNHPQEGVPVEELPDDNPEVLEFLNPPDPNAKAAKAAEAFLSLPATEQIKPENAVPFLLGWAAHQLGRPDLIPAIIASAQPSPAAQSTQVQIAGDFSV